MSKTFAAAIGLLALTFFSCQDNTPPKLLLENLEYVKNIGPGCDTPEAEGADCVALNLRWPTVKEGPDALKKNVEAWATAYVSGILAPASDAPTGKGIEAAAAAFVQMQKDFVKEVPEAVTRYFTAECQGRTLLNDGQYLTLEMEGYTYAGGAHGLPTAAVATFQIANGKKLTINDLVSDLAAFQILAEKAFRAERADIFNPTDGSEPFKFDDTFPFALPQNYGLAPEGIYCYYTPYEVGPYAIGSTQFIILTVIWAAC
jgi:Protein of unknown function (DUF3298).